MNQKLAVPILFLVFIWGLLVSCQANDSIVTLTKTAVSTPQVGQVTETAVPSTITPTNRLSLEPSPTATLTQLPITTATATTIPTPSFSLTKREPTLEEIEEFLSLSPVMFFYQDRGLELVSLDDYFTEHDLSEFTEVFYEDINGDSEADLILADMFPFFWSDSFVIVTLWNGDQYSTPLVIMDGAKYQPGLRVT